MTGCLYARKRLARFTTTALINDFLLGETVARTSNPRWMVTGAGERVAIDSTAFRRSAHLAHIDNKWIEFGA